MIPGLPHGRAEEGLDGARKREAGERPRKAATDAASAGAADSAHGPGSSRRPGTGGRTACRRPSAWHRSGLRARRSAGRNDDGGRRREAAPLR
ncbi:MAG: hypothetical protein E6J76_15615, partial [Deltaproteobacteria bacterium]